MALPDTLHEVEEWVQDLIVKLRALREAAEGDAEAENIERIALECQAAFSKLRDLGTFAPVTLGFTREDGQNRTAALFRELKESYEDCIQALWEALARAGEKLSELQKIQAVSKCYGKVAALK